MDAPSSIHAVLSAKAEVNRSPATRPRGSTGALREGGGEPVYTTLGIMLGMCSPRRRR